MPGRATPPFDSTTTRAYRRRDTLGRKILLGSLGLMFAMSLAIVGVLAFLFRTTRGSLERAVAEDDIRRFALLIDDDLSQLQSIALSWTYSHDGYVSAAKRLAGPMATKLGGGAATGPLGLSAMVIRGAGGDVVYRFEDRPGLADTLAADIDAGLSPRARDASGGLALSGGDIYLVAVRAIRGDGASVTDRGVIAMARRVDGAWKDRYSRLLGREADVGLSPGGRGGEIALEWTDYTSRVSMDIPGIAAGESMRLSLTSPSLAARYGAVGFIVLMLIVLAIIGGAGAPAILALEDAVFGRMRRIGADLDALLVTGDPNYRITVVGNDELATLCLAVNRSLDQLGSIISERDEMLREIHHRVKNNLQVIASLLSLQAGSTVEGEALEALEVNRKRVQIMAIVHEMVLAHPSGEKLAMLPLLQHAASIAAHSRRRYGDTFMRFEGDDLALGMDTALSVALMAGEAIDDALARAHPEGERSDIAIGVGRLGEDKFFMEIRDASAGQPGSDDRGFGLVIIEALSMQLRGTLSITRGARRESLFRLEAPLG